VEAPIDCSPDAARALDVLQAVIEPLDFWLRHTLGRGFERSEMAAAIARFLARRVPATQAEADILKQIALFCCAGLLVSLLMMTYGLDLSPGFF
jgi:hypothetical protein